MFINALLFLLLSLSAGAQTPQPAAGTIRHFEAFPSRFVQARNVDVWLPDNYSPEKRYAVLYMHDGQMLFDSTITWNRQEWGVDETLSALLRRKKIQDCIVVGIWSIPEQRYADYYPQKALDYTPEPTRSELLAGALKNGPNADNYLRFLTQELKPFIDSAFFTRTDPAHTFIMGSSMGGLISAYALCEYPNVFGGAACLSIHSPMVLAELADSLRAHQANAGFCNYLEKHLPRANSRKIYFDHGDQTLDAYYAPFQSNIDAVMRRKGYRKPHWRTRVFPGTDHSERAWAGRLAGPVRFLLGG
jgi:enterochelin esterase-like enzyme